MLEKAERSILRQGFFILGCAMMNVIVRLLTRFVAMGLQQFYLQGLIVLSVYNLSHIGISLVVLLSVELRRHFQCKLQRSFPNHQLRERAVNRVFRITTF
ncbi:hypothetical protein GCK32_021453 [Trichostrongylus colubriformis]